MCLTALRISCLSVKKRKFSICVSAARELRFKVAHGFPSPRTMALHLRESMRSTCYLVTIILGDAFAFAFKHLSHQMGHRKIVCYFGVFLASLIAWPNSGNAMHKCTAREQDSSRHCTWHAHLRLKCCVGSHRFMRTTSCFLFWALGEQFPV